MFEVRVRPGRNRLYFIMRGSITEADAKAAADLLLAEVRKLRPGFDTISDISGLEPLTAEALEHIRRINSHLLALQRGRLIRVVGKSVNAAVQFERMSKSHGYSAELAFSLEEAERILDGELG